MSEKKSEGTYEVAHRDNHLFVKTCLFIHCLCVPSSVLSPAGSTVDTTHANSLPPGSIPSSWDTGSKAHGWVHGGLGGEKGMKWENGKGSHSHHRHVWDAQVTRWHWNEDPRWWTRKEKQVCMFAGQQAWDRRMGEGRGVGIRPQTNSVSWWGPEWLGSCLHSMGVLQAFSVAVRSRNLHTMQFTNLNCTILDKEDVIHIYNGILLSHKKEWNNAICSNMDGPRGYHTKWSKSDRERQIPYDITYLWNLKYDTNEPIYETETESWT